MTVKRLYLASTAPKKTKTMTKPKARGKSSIPRSVNFGNQPFPAKTTATLVYAEQINITLVSGAYQNYVFCANGLYDPNYTGTGSQPLYFDQLMAIYNHYVVTESTITISPIIPAAATMCSVVLFQDDDTSTGSITNHTSAMMRPGCVYAQTNGSVASLTPTSLKSTWKAKNVFTGDPVGRDELQGSASTNPPEGTYFYIGVNDSSLSSSSIIINVVVRYKATFYELKTIPVS